MSNKSSEGISLKDLQAQLNALKEENATLKAKKIHPLTMKVAEKSGGMSLYGLQRFPLTLFKAQWERVIEHVPQIQAFLEANKDSLKVKE